MPDYQPVFDALVSCDIEKVKELVRGYLDANADAQEILEKGLIAGMDIVGEKMENEEMFIPEVLRAARAMGAGVDILKPFLGEEGSSNKGRVVIGTVKGDLHDIGKNLVSMMMESAGLEVHDLGVDVEPAKFVDAVREKNPQILCLSALLTTTIPMMQQTVEVLKESGLKDSTRIMVGGAPVTQAFADEIGADAYAPDAGSAAKKAKSMIQSSFTKN